MTPVLRPLTGDDWPGVLALETETYAGSGLSEDAAALASRAGRDTSFVLAADRRIVGYVLALPYPRFRCPDLTRADTTAFASDNLHLHDLVVARGHRRAGLGTRLLRHLTGEARRRAYRLISLVAVGDGASFWSAHGFRRHPGITPPAVYGPGAAYMSRPLSSEGDEPHALGPPVVRPVPAGDRRAVLLPGFPIQHLGVADPGVQGAAAPRRG